MHHCAHCDYKSIYRGNVLRHQSKKHKMLKEEVVQYQLPLLHQEQPTDWQLMEDSIQVFKIYKLLQRMKNKKMKICFILYYNNFHNNISYGLFPCIANNIERNLDCLIASITSLSLLLFFIIL